MSPRRGIRTATPPRIIRDTGFSVLVEASHALCHRQVVIRLAKTCKNLENDPRTGGLRLRLKAAEWEKPRRRTPTDADGQRGFFYQPEGWGGKDSISELASSNRNTPSTTPRPPRRVRQELPRNPASAGAPPPQKKRSSQSEYSTFGTNATPKLSAFGFRAYFPGL